MNYVATTRQGIERCLADDVVTLKNRVQAGNIRLMLRGRAGAPAGRGPQHLVPPGDAYGSWTTTDRSVRFDTHMGLKVERATADEQAEERWEG